jgi:hypothetical protein
LSRDKGRSKNPGTNSSVPGLPGTKSLSRTQKTGKGRSKTGKIYSKTEKDILKKEKTF